jgi:endonuclease/exonuclease/phosphatase family metal-dependent hydrolase
MVPSINSLRNSLLSSGDGPSVTSNQREHQDTKRKNTSKTVVNRRRFLKAASGSAVAGLLGIHSIKPASARSGPPAREMTVLNWNIHYGSGTDGVYDLSRTIDVIDQSGADLVALQEVDRHFRPRSNFDDQPEILSDRLNMHYTYAANLNYPPTEASNGERRQYGILILSDRKYPILESKQYLLPRPLDREQRGLLETTINVAGQRLRFYTTHLQAGGSAKESRVAQINKIIDVTGSINDQMVLTGDINATPDSSTVDPLYETFDGVFSSNTQSNTFTFPATEPDRQIDYVFTANGVETLDAAVIDTQASDHLPIRSTHRLDTAPGRSR